MPPEPCGLRVDVTSVLWWFWRPEVTPTWVSGLALDQRYRLLDPWVAARHTEITDKLDSLARILNQAVKDGQRLAVSEIARREHGLASGVSGQDAESDPTTT